MPVIICLFMNSIVIASSFIITYKLLRIPNFIDSLISWFIVYFSQVVLSELFLGILGILYLKTVISLNLIILLIVWLIAKNRLSTFTLDGIKETVFQLLRSKTILLGICVILGFGLVKFGINLINPPFGWDSLNYHFTFPVEWIKHGNLGNPITISDDPSPSYYPINGSLLFLWLILPFKNVFLADLGQIPFFVLAFLAVYSQGIKLNLNKENSCLAACLFTIIPNYFKQAKIAYVDVMVAALFLVCLTYLFLLNKEFVYKNVLVYSLSLGLLLGHKTLSLPYSALLFLPFIYLSCKHYLIKPSLDKKIPWIFFIISLLFIIALGGFSYIRNFMDTGNPLYPLNFGLFGRNIFKGVIDTHIYRVHFTLQDYSLAKLLFHEGLGLQSLIFILPAMFVVLPITLTKKRKILDFNLTYFLILPFLVYIVYRYIIPLANTRYLYPLLGIGIIIGFYTAEIINIPKRILNILVVICTLASVSELAKRQELIASITLTFLLFFLFCLINHYQENKGRDLSVASWDSGFLSTWVKKSAIFFLFLILGCSLILLEKDYIRNEYPRYVKMIKYSGFWPDATRAWDWLNLNTKGNNIAYVGRPVPFPLYGTNFKNNVYYVSVNKTEPAKLHYFPNSQYYWGYDFLSLHKSFEEKGNYRSVADYNVWCDNLLRRNTDYLFIYSLHQTKEIIFPSEDIWAAAHPGKFIPVFTNDTIHIYKLIK